MIKIAPKTKIIAYTIIMILSIVQGTAISQFLHDDTSYKETGDSYAKPKANTSVLGKDIALNIRAELVPGIMGAVKISFDRHSDADDDFIVGRSFEVTDKTERALAAISIRVIPAGAKPEVIDTNLPAGRYYYCVISKRRILDQEIELYPNMNYTTSPVIVGSEGYKPVRKGLPPQVSLIYARKMSKGRILVTWKGVQAANVIYTVYRGYKQLDSAAKIKRAETVAVISDGRESYIDRNINQSANYYYAVTSKDIHGNEDLNLIPDQSYTVSGVFVNVGSLGTVNNLKAFPLGDDAIKLTWAKRGLGISQFLIYRHDREISDANRLALAKYIDSVSSTERSYVDRGAGYGDTYYAVLAKLDTGKVNDRLNKGENYTTSPISLGKTVRIKSISSLHKGRDVEILWQFSGSTGTKSYRIIRSENRIKTRDDIKNAYIVDHVNVFDQFSIDREPPPGEYYYAIVPENIERNYDYKLVAGVNVTLDSINVGGKRKKKPKIAKPKPKPKKVEKPVVAKKVVPPPVTPPVTPTVIPLRKSEIDYTEVDQILHEFFFKNKFKAALENLKELLEKSGSDVEIAKTKLFIGRSLLELGRYREALDYLILPDVKQHFPQESRFWKQYVLARIR